MNEIMALHYYFPHFLTPHIQPSQNTNLPSHTHTTTNHHCATLVYLVCETDELEHHEHHESVNLNVVMNIAVTSINYACEYIKRKMVI
jgi:hypothetical protein